MVRRSDGKGRLLSLRSDELSRSSSLLHSLFISGVVWPESICAAHAGSSGQHRSRVVSLEIRSRNSALGRTSGGTGDGAVPRVHLLWPLFHSRGLAPSFFNDVCARVAWPLARRNRKLPLVYRDGYHRNDPDQGNLHHSPWLRPARAADRLCIDNDCRGRGFEARCTEMELI